MKIEKYKFKDPDIVLVINDGVNKTSDNVELVFDIDEKIEAVLIYKEDVVALAKHFGLDKVINDES